MTKHLTQKGECAKRGLHRRDVLMRGADRWMACEDCGNYLARIGARYTSGTVGQWYTARSRNLPRKSILRPVAT